MGRRDRERERCVGVAINVAVFIVTSVNLVVAIVVHVRCRSGVRWASGGDVLVIVCVVGSVAFVVVGCVHEEIDDLSALCGVLPSPVTPLFGWGTKAGREGMH